MKNEIKRPEVFIGKKAVNETQKLWYQDYIPYQKIKCITDIVPLPVCLMDDTSIITNDTLSHCVKEIYDFTGEGFISGDHGHHAAGIIADKIYGLFPNTKIGLFKVLRTNGTGRNAWLINAIDVAFKNNYQVISASLGSDYPNSDLYSSLDKIQYSKNVSLKRYIKKLLGYKFTDKPIYFVSAAGNDSKDVDYPAAYGLPYILSIGSAELVDGELRVAWYSSVGRITFCVPGSDILSSIMNNEYQYMSGTSMAVPFVAGMIAQCLAIDSNLTIEKFTNIAVQSCSKIDSDKNKQGLGFCYIDRFIENVIKNK